MVDDADDQRRARTVKRISDMQLAPVKTLPMTLFTLWMVGNDIHIFSIMFVSMAVSQPFAALLNTSKTFQFFESDPTVATELFRGKIIHMLCCCVAIAVGLVKLGWMGLMPTSAADWMDHGRPTTMERAYGVFA